MRVTEVESNLRAINNTFGISTRCMVHRTRKPWREVTAAARVLNLGLSITTQLVGYCTASLQCLSSLLTAIKPKNHAN